MLAGCSSTLLSPRHRLRSEASAQFQACHNIPTMSTQRLDIPCNFARKDASNSRSQPNSIRPVVGLSIEKPMESKTTGCSLRQNIKLPPSATECKKGSMNKKKRYAGEVSFDEESFMSSRVKRKRGNNNGKKCDDGLSEEEEEGEGYLSLGQLGSENFWFHPGFDVPRSVVPDQLPFSLSCSGEEESVCFVQSDVIAPPNLPPLSNIPWFDSVVTEITGFGKKNVGPEKEISSGSTSSTSSDHHHHGLVLRLSGSTNPVIDHHEIGNNGSSPPNPSEGPGTAIHNGEENNNHTEHECVELVSLLVSCVEQIGSKNIASVSHCLARLGEVASPRGTPIHRLATYFTEALALRVARLWPHIFHIGAHRDLDRVEDESGTALRLLNQVTPIPKFIHFTSNEIILRAFEGKERVHIIDFDVKQGLQWPSLFQSLASRSNPPRHVRITGIGESKQELIETGDRLAGFAEALNLPFEFHPVVDRLEDVRLWMLHVKERETVVVNCVLQLHKMLYDGTGGVIRDFLSLIRSTNAEVVVVAEQEGAHDEMSLDARICNALRYYSAVFDSVDLSLPSDSALRVKIEEMFGREIRNIVACEGRERFERHQRFEKWEQVMEQGRFRHMGISEREVLQGEMMLKMYECENYRVEKRDQNGASITLSWLDQPLYTVSAWKPVDIAGSSS